MYQLLLLPGGNLSLHMTSTALFGGKGCAAVVLAVAAAVMLAVAAAAAIAIALLWHLSSKVL